jgi:hypothetical protein
VLICGIHITKYSKSCTMKLMRFNYQFLNRNGEEIKTWKKVTSIFLIPVSGFNFLTTESQCCYLEMGGFPNHLARKPVPLQSEQHIEPWKKKSKIQNGTYMLACASTCRYLNMSRFANILTYLSSTNNTSGISGRNLAEHVIAKNEESCTPTPLAFNLPIWIARSTRNWPWLL